MGTQEEHLRLLRDTAEVARARQHVGQFCAGMAGDVRSIAQLLTSELVTNAIEHGTGGIELRVTASRDTVRIEVADESPGIPARREPQVEQPSGRGLMLVERLSSAWGATPATVGCGKAVWFTLSLRH